MRLEKELESNEMSIQDITKLCEQTKASFEELLMLMKLIGLAS